MPPQTYHLAAVHRILRYLKGEPGQGFLYLCHGHIKAEAYNDDDWVESKDLIRTITVGGNPAP